MVKVLRNYEALTRTRASTTVCGVLSSSLRSTAWPSATLRPPGLENLGKWGRSSTVLKKRGAERRRRAGDGIKSSNFLRGKSVGTSTLRNYQSATNRFLLWVRDNCGSGAAASTMALNTVDSRMCEFFNELYFQGYGPGTGRHTLFGFVFLYVDDAEADAALPSARRTLLGWTKCSPGTVGLPVPEPAILLVAHDLMKRGSPLMAACVLLQWDSYSRPSEAVLLTRDDVIPPRQHASGAASKRWALQFCSEESGRRTKTGGTDDTVLVGIGGRHWVCQVLHALTDVTAAGQCLFPFALPEYEKGFSSAVRRLGLEQLKVSPHSLRHAGPSGDIMDNHMTLPEVQKRGRWACFRSVVRYEKHARLLKQLHKMSNAQLTQAKRCEAALKTELPRRIRAGQ